MNSTPMTHLHQRSCPWTWQLDAGQATTLRAADAPRWLRVDEGCLWVTAIRGGEGPQAEDIWLAPGQSLALPGGSAWVLQAWPHARLSLLQAAPAATRAVSSWQAARWLFWQRVRQRVRPRVWPRVWA